MQHSLLIKNSCRHCDQIFYVCQSCWRGQAYCCELCRSIAQKQQRKAARKRYRQTKKGKRNHQKTERKRRGREKNEKKTETVGDASPTPGGVYDTVPIIEPDNPPCCRFCGAGGSVVSHFPRRSYGNHRLRQKSGSVSRL